MRSCKECGSTNTLMKQGKDYICMECYFKSKPSESELERIVEDSIKYNLIYIDPVFKKIVREKEKIWWKENDENKD